MLSTSKIGGFTLSHPQTNDKLFKKHRFTSHMISPLEHYKTQLTRNANQLKKKYPSADLDYIRSLLEELQNNIEMVADLLQEEHEKNAKNIMEDQPNQMERLQFMVGKQKPDVSKTQDVKVLQKSVAKLFQKFCQQKKQKEDLLKKLAMLSKQNENLKLMNQQLMKEQMNQSSIMKNLDIC